MMMPANYSAISENEMTYVSGGSVALEDILAPKLTVENWQNFNKNMVTIIGNNFVSDYVTRTIGSLFSGAYTPGMITTKWANNVAKIYNQNAATTSTSGWVKFRNGAYGVLNAGLYMLGNAAAIYNLATGTVGNSVEDKAPAFNSLFDVKKN